MPRMTSRCSYVLQGFAEAIGHRRRRFHAEMRQLAHYGPCLCQLARAYSTPYPVHKDVRSARHGIRPGVFQCGDPAAPSGPLFHEIHRFRRRKRMDVDIGKRAANRAQHANSAGGCNQDAARPAASLCVRPPPPALPSLRGSRQRTYRIFNEPGAGVVCAERARPARFESDNTVDDKADRVIAPYHAAPGVGTCRAQAGPARKAHSLIPGDALTRSIFASDWYHHSSFAILIPAAAAFAGGAMDVMRKTKARSPAHQADAAPSSKIQAPSSAHG